MAAATFERQAELLETIHRCARELRELAGDALEITIAPARKNGARPGPKPGARARIAPEDLEPKVREAFRILGRSTASGVRKHYGLAKGSSTTRRITDTVRELADRGELTAVAKAQGGHPIYELSQLPGGASSNGFQVSPRVRKSVERAEHEPVDAAPDPDAPPERVRRACAEDAGTLTELAMRLDLPRRVVASCIEQLLDQDRIVKCGHRQPLNHVVYGAVDE